MNIAKFGVAFLPVLGVAFSPVLNYYQKIGYEKYGLPIRLVKLETFGNHTLRAIDILDEKNITAFPEICKLNKAQAEGLSEFDLTVPQIHSPNFDKHTLEAMIELKKLNPNSTNQSNFAIVKGLNETETIRTISSYKMGFLKQAINKKSDKKSLKSLNKKNKKRKKGKGKKQ